MKTTGIIYLMSHMKTLDLASKMWKKFEILYQDIGFTEHNAIIICLFTSTISDFANVAKSVDCIKLNLTCLQEIGTTDMPNW